MQQLEVGVGPATLKLNCTPIINLFKQTAEPILLSAQQVRVQHCSRCAPPLAMEVFSIEEVLSSTLLPGEITYFEPFYSYRHGAARDKGQTFWQATRRQSNRRNDDGTEMSLSLVDLSGRPMRPDFDAITVRTICSNRDLPPRMPIGNEMGDLEPQGLAPIRKVTVLAR
jgi:type VI secretion system protein ImpG